jgi:hypothetical protein
MDAGCVRKIEEILAALHRIPAIICPNTVDERGREEKGRALKQKDGVCRAGEDCGRGVAERGGGE